MSLNRLVIKDYRNIVHADLTFGDRFNFILGNNGSGKTNLLEAIYLLGHGRAFRQVQSHRLIRYNQPELVLHGRLTVNQYEHQVGLIKSRQNINRIKIDGKEGQKIADLAHLLPIQLITPEGFTLLTGGPKYRRAFIDWGCFYTYPAFLRLWTHLKRLLKQRNVQLRHINQYQQLHHWDVSLIKYTQQITHFRQHYIEQILPILQRLLDVFLPEYQINVSFYSGWDSETDYTPLLIKQFMRDKQYNYTTLGAHKADLQLRVNQLPVDAVLSRGQLKLLMCALRLTQGAFLHQQKGIPCLYLIDDFSSELDIQKRTLLIQQLNMMESQVFITAIEQHQISSFSEQNDKIFYVNCGKISH